MKLKLGDNPFHCPEGRWSGICEAIDEPKTPLKNRGAKQVRLRFRSCLANTSARAFVSKKRRSLLPVLLNFPGMFTNQGQSGLPDSLGLRDAVRATSPLLPLLPLNQAEMRIHEYPFT